jgi:hypothetical protein
MSGSISDPHPPTRPLPVVPYRARPQNVRPGSSGGTGVTPPVPPASPPHLEGTRRCEHQVDWHVPPADDAAVVTIGCFAADGGPSTAVTRQPVNETPRRTQPTARTWSGRLRRPLR